MSRFAPIPTSAILDSRLSTRDVTVLAAFCSFADVAGWCYPRMGAIGDMLGITRQAVQKSVRILRECGYMESRERIRSDGGQSSNMIRVLYDTEHPAEALRKVAPPATPEVAPPATPEVAPPATPEVAPPATPEVAHNNPSNNPPEHKEGQLFEERRVAKEKQARKPKSEMTFDGWMDSIGDQDPISASDPIFDWMQHAGIPREWQELAWIAFMNKFEANTKTKYADWPAAFRNYVRNDWLKVWRVQPDGTFVLTTAGEQLRRVKEAEDRAASEGEAA